jgi:glutaredoxin
MALPPAGCYKVSIQVRGVPMRTLAVALAALATAASAQIFKWSDAAGKTHYGDRPPAEAQAQELAIHVPSYDGPVQVQDWGAILRRKPAAAAASVSSVTMYSTSWCPHCKRARAYFAENGIRFTEIDVEKSASGRRDYEALGASGVPVIVVGGKMMRGFSPEGFERLRRKS